ncbi:hypothetical protein EMCG_04756 [[Emmonsia] crescens]|uniref:Uncharacterized protein n=1 Tax=[Emmonsia] crescens TaxID=73230 RepID=A0A0G2IYH3_9EURO|nr:hypothetical protein EMCG_04756 [Emmonsia crescens UAMH 3008]
MLVPYLNARHGEENSPEVRRKSFHVATNYRYPNASSKTVTAKQHQNGELSSRFLQPSAASVRRISSLTIQAFDTEECWRFGEFISTNYANTDAREPPKVKRRKCQTVQYRQYSPTENISGPGEVARPVKISRPAKPKLITIQRSSPCRAAPHGKSVANEFAHEFIVFEKLSSISNSLSLPPRGVQSSSPCDDSGYATQDSYSSIGDISPLFPDGRAADASPRLVRRRFSLKSQIPRWIQKNSPVHKNEPSFGDAGECHSSSCAPTLPRLALLSPASPSEENKTLMATCWTVGWTLDHLEASMMQIPRPNLTLSSPVIIFVRSTTEKTLLEPFRDIFPSAPIEKLSSLCAAFVAQIYLSSLETSEHTNNNPVITGNVVDGISDKARTRLGLHLSRTSQLRFKERLLRTRGADINARLDEIVDKLLVDVCGTSDSSLKGALVALVQLLEGNKSSGSILQA